jgi:hypothetical protein
MTVPPQHALRRTVNPLGIGRLALLRRTGAGAVRKHLPILATPECGLGSLPVVIRIL